MQNKFINKLAEKPTRWPIWFVIFPFFSLVFSSLIVGIFASLPGVGGFIGNLSPILQFFVSFGLVYIVFSILSKKKPSASDLGFDTKALTKKNIILVIGVFIITHILFFLFAKIGGNPSNAAALFTDSGFGKGFFSDLILIIAGTICAPVFEELIYRGFMLRSAHDGMLKFFPKSTSIFGIPAIFAIVVVALAFILPHVSDFSINIMTISYFITSAGFSIVYLLTRSMVAAMVSHSLQSCFAFSQILILGHGDYPLSPVIYGISFLCPIIVYFIGRGMQKGFMKNESLKK
ncbi:MAG: type II CAAX endopeptidase family protein [Gallicola sp.]|nr:type II CAAX endopeptidase family protein [Gallicola sp.]